MIQQQETAIVVRRQRAEVIVCPHCNELVCQDPSCSNCAAIFDQQGLIDMLVGLKARRPDPPLAA